MTRAIKQVDLAQPQTIYLAKVFIFGVMAALVVLSLWRSVFFYLYVLYNDEKHYFKLVKRTILYIMSTVKPHLRGHLFLQGPYL